MRRILAVLVAVSLGSALIGCGHSSHKNTPQPTEDPHQALSWTLTLNSVCDANVADDQCIAKHGFTVKTDGLFQIGPGPGHETRVGMLTQDEYKALNSALANSLTASFMPQESHDTLDSIDTQDIITLTRGNNPQETLIKTKGTEFVYFTVSAEEAKSLYQMVRGLAAKYYMLPFPDACLDGAASLRALYQSMLTCTQDTDCAYFEDFEPATAAGTVTTDDCSIVPPLAIANASLVQESKAKLTEALGALRNACGERITRSECTQPSTLQITDSKPACQQGMCVVKTAR